jgi:hypothetical protein
MAGALGGAALISMTPRTELVDLLYSMGVTMPIDLTALMATGAIVMGSVCWAACYLVWGRGGVLAPSHRRSSDRPMRRLVHQPVIERRTRAQWPIAAVDIPAPTPRARPVPADLDQPLSAFDPNAIPIVPFESIRRQGLRPER